MCDFQFKIQADSKNETISFFDKEWEFPVGYFSILIMSLSNEELNLASSKLNSALTSTHAPLTIPGYYFQFQRLARYIDEALSTFKSDDERFLFSTISYYIQEGKYSPLTDEITDQIYKAYQEKDYDRFKIFSALDDSEYYRDSWADNFWKSFFYDRKTLPPFKRKWFHETYRGAMLHVSSLAKDVSDTIQLKERLLEFMVPGDASFERDRELHDWISANNTIDSEGAIHSLTELIAFEQHVLYRNHLSVHECDACGKLFFDTEPFACLCPAHRTDSDIKEWKNQKKNYRRRLQYTAKNMYQQELSKYQNWVNKHLNIIKDIQDKETRATFSKEISDIFEQWRNKTAPKQLLLEELLSQPFYSDSEITALEEEIKAPCTRDRAPLYYEYVHAK